MKNSSDTIGNRIHDLPICSAVPQPLRHRVPHKNIVPQYISYPLRIISYLEKCTREINRLVEGSGPFGPDALRPYMNLLFVPQSFPHRSPAALLKRQMAPRVVRCMSSGSKNKEPK
jgi:hypothetical protein